MDTTFPPVLSQKMQKKLISALHPRVREFNKGELIMEKEPVENRLCLLLKGTAYLWIENEHAAKQLLDFFMKGEFFCYEMLPAAPNCHCFIQAKYHCSVAYLSPIDITEYVTSNPSDELGSFFRSIFHNIIISRNEHCHMLQQKRIRDKLLAFLHYQAALQNTDFLQMPIPYSDLADYLTIDRSAMMTELTKMHADGLIRKELHSIQLLAKKPQQTL